MKVTIEKIEVDLSETYVALIPGPVTWKGPVTWWVTAQVEDETGPYFLDDFAVDPGMWDLILGVGEVGMVECVAEEKN